MYAAVFADVEVVGLRYYLKVEMSFNSGRETRSLLRLPSSEAAVSSLTELKGLLAGVLQTLILILSL